MSKITILIVDDHEVVRRGIRALLSEEEDFQVIGEAENGEQGLDMLRELKPDLALIDIRMKGMSGSTLCRLARQEGLETMLVILTSYADEELVQTCLQLGVQGYILKDIHGFDLVQSIRSIMEGESILAPQATSVAMRWIQDSTKRTANSKTLSLRDIEILQLMAEGLTNREIGQKLYLSENTIKTYVLDIFRHLEVKNRIEAVVTAYRQGIL